MADIYDKLSTVNDKNDKVLKTLSKKDAWQIFRNRILFPSNPEYNVQGFVFDAAGSTLFGLDDDKEETNKQNNSSKKPIRKEEKVPEPSKATPDK